jgi:two-component system, OmpR family, response regulator
MSTPVCESAPMTAAALPAARVPVVEDDREMDPPLLRLSVAPGTSPTSPRTAGLHLARRSIPAP